MRLEFSDVFDDLDPLFYNETASVSFLASAASRAGLLSLCEYVATKRLIALGRPHMNGRCDLWIADKKKGSSWAFEFKQMFTRSKPRRSTIEERLRIACRDAHSVHPDEADKSFGALLLLCRDKQEWHEQTEQMLEDLGSEVLYSCKFEHSTSPAYLFIDKAAK